LREHCAGAAVINYLIGTAKLNALDPEVILRYVLERVADYTITEYRLYDYQIDELLRSNIVANSNRLNWQPDQLVKTASSARFLKHERVTYCPK
jgi:hypothetical protein